MVRLVPKKKQGAPKAVEKPRVPFALLFRMFVIGTLAVGASGYAVYRYFTMRTPVTRPAEGEIPAPDLEPVPSSR